MSSLLWLVIAARRDHRRSVAVVLLMRSRCVGDPGAGRRGRRVVAGRRTTPPDVPGTSPARAEAGPRRAPARSRRCAFRPRCGAATRHRYGRRSGTSRSCRPGPGCRGRRRARRPARRSSGRPPSRARPPRCRGSASTGARRSSPAPTAAGARRPGDHRATPAEPAPAATTPTPAATGTDAARARAPSPATPAATAAAAGPRRRTGSSEPGADRRIRPRRAAGTSRGGHRRPAVLVPDRPGPDGPATRPPPAARPRRRRRPRGDPSAERPPGRATLLSARVADRHPAGPALDERRGRPMVARPWRPRLGRRRPARDVAPRPGSQGLGGGLPTAPTGCDRSAGRRVRAAVEPIR